MQEFLQVVNLLVIPAFGYIIILERRITKLQMQVEMLLERFTGERQGISEREKAFSVRK